MPTDMMYRSFRPDLEVRSSGDGRTIYGIAVPYNAPTRIDDQLVEQFERGAFNHQLGAAHRVKFAREHVLLGGVLIGAASAMRDDASGLYVELRASKTPVGDETLELVRDGALNQLSIMFRERQNRNLAGGITARVKADLHEVAVVMEGAYGELASAVGIRAAGGRTPNGQDLGPISDAALRAQAEEFLNLQAAPDDLEIRRIRLGL